MPEGGRKKLQARAEVTRGSGGKESQAEDADSEIVAGSSDTRP
jgi:hypothetical protein